MKVHTHIAGSKCVVQLTRDYEHYIEDRGAYIEYVRNGFVRAKMPSTQPAETIIEMIRKYKRGEI